MRNDRFTPRSRGGLGTAGIPKRTVALVVLVALGVGCGGENGPSHDTGPATLSVSPHTLTLYIGGHGTLTPVVTDSTGASLPTADVVWKSLAPGIATVARGTVTGVSLGVTMATATLAGKADTAAIRVIPSDSVIPDSVTLEITPRAATIPVGGTMQFVASAYHADGTGAPLPAVQWASSNPAVAAVLLGLAAGVTAGTSMISVTAAGGLTASAVLVVAPTALACDGIEMVQQWSAELDYTYDQALLTGTNNQVSVSHAGEFTATLLPAFGTLPTTRWQGTIAGTASVNDRVVDLNATPNAVETLAGSGPPITGLGRSSLILDADLATCTFKFSLNPFLHMTLTTSGSPPQTADLALGWFRTEGVLGAWRALTIHDLSAQFDAHFILGSDSVDVYVPLGEGMRLWDGAADPQAPRGSAIVSYRFKAE